MEHSLWESVNSDRPGGTTTTTPATPCPEWQLIFARLEFGSDRRERALFNCACACVWSAEERALIARAGLPVRANFCSWFFCYYYYYTVRYLWCLTATKRSSVARDQPKQNGGTTHVRTTRLHGTTTGTVQSVVLVWSWRQLSLVWSFFFFLLLCTATYYQYYDLTCFRFYFCLSKRRVPHSRHKCF